MLGFKKLEETSKEWAIQARKFERSFEGKSTRRFKKLFPEAGLEGLKISGFENVLFFQKKNEKGILKTPIVVYAVIKGEEVVGVKYKLQEPELYSEIPEFILNKEREILNIFGEIYPEYSKVHKIIYS